MPRRQARKQGSGKAVEKKIELVVDKLIQSAKVRNIRQLPLTFAVLHGQLHAAMQKHARNKWWLQRATVNPNANETYSHLEYNCVWCSGALSEES